MGLLLTFINIMISVLFISQNNILKYYLHIIDNKALAFPLVGSGFNTRQWWLYSVLYTFKAEPLWTVKCICFIERKAQNIVKFSF